MSFAFIENPQGNPLSDRDFLNSALEQPLSLATTAWETAKGGVLESFGLGTAIRDTITPDAVREPFFKGEPTTPPPAPGERRRFTLDEARRGAQEQWAKALSQDEYKASSFYRDSVPWEEGMTQERAASLAEQADRKAVRDFYAAKRPITAFFGNLAGQAVDPINYIPVFGEAVVAANTARFGRVAGRALTASADAMANTAAFGLLTAPTRKALGDDVSWQTTVSQIAIAGLIGAGFGAIHGRFGRATPDELRADAEEKLATLENVQKARVALNDAIDGLVHDGEVRLSETSAGYVNDAAVAINRGAAIAPHNPWEQFDAYSPRDISDATVPGTVFHGTSHGNFDQFDPYSGEYGLMGAGSYFTENPRIAAEYTTKGKGTEPAVYEARVRVENPLDMDARADVEAWRKAFGEYLTGEDFDGNQIDYSGRTNEQMYREVEENLSQEMIPSYEGAEIMQDGIRSMGHDSVTHIGGGRHKDSKGIRHRVWIVFDPEQATITNRHFPTEAPRIAADASAPARDPDPAVAEAAKNVGRPDDVRAMSEQYRVDPETGDFAELDEIEALRQSGRLTEEDEAALAEAEDTMKQAAGFGEALKVFARCVDG